MHEAMAMMVGATTTGSGNDDNNTVEMGSKGCGSSYNMVDMVGLMMIIIMIVVS